MITPNAPLLRRTLEHIKANPQQHDQTVWRTTTACGTVACYAGWAAELAGGEWIGGGDLLVAVPEDDGKEVFFDAIDAAARAQRILGLTEDQADALFYSENNLERIERIVDDLCAAAEQEKLRVALHAAVDAVEPPEGAPLPGHVHCQGDKMCADCAAYDAECHEDTEAAHPHPNH